MLSTIILLGIITYLVYRTVARPKDFPPGPSHTPLIGYAPFLGKGSHKKITELAQKYGDIIGFNIFFKRVVVLSSSSAIREAFKDDACNGKPQTYAMQLRSRGKYGIVATEGDTWRNVRRFTLSVLRDFGLGKTSIESIITEEVRELTRLLQQQQGKPLNMKKYLENAIVNTLWIITTGERFKQGDAKVSQLRDFLNELHDASSIGSIAMYIPYVPAIPPSLVGMGEGQRLISQISKLITGVINRHRENQDKQGHTDFIHTFLSKVNETRDKMSPFHQETGISNLLNVCGEFFVGGTLSTSDTLTWLLMSICHYPEYQTKIHEELDNVLGKQQVTYDDLKRLPYTYACILEAQRYACIVTTVFHRTIADTTVRGYKIPKDATVMGNLYAVFRDPKVWERPNEYYPNNYLNEDGTLKNEEHHVPFSAGKRMCIGESLARFQLALFTVSLLQNFRFSFPPEEPVPPKDTDSSFFRLCPQHNLLVASR